MKNFSHAQHVSKKKKSDFSKFLSSVTPGSSYDEKKGSELLH